MTGTDLTQIDGIDVRTAATVISEAGWDMSKWRTENHFVSWLRLCPDNRVSGDKVIGKRRLPINNRLSVAFKIAASTFTSKQYLFGSAVPPIEDEAWAPPSRSRLWPPSWPAWSTE
jgi:transposase